MEPGTPAAASGAGEGAGAGAAEPAGSPSGKAAHVPELSEEEKERQLHTEQFRSFLGRASTVMERAVGQASSFDIMVRGRTAGRLLCTAKWLSHACHLVPTDGRLCRWTMELKMSKHTHQRRSCPSMCEPLPCCDRVRLFRDVSAGARLLYQASFASEELCHGRAVTDLAWSPHHRELLLTSFDRGTGRQLQGDGRAEGLALVWSMVRAGGVRWLHVVSLSRARIAASHSDGGAQAPEYTFNCQTAVLSAAFHTFDPHLVLGGTYSGQVRDGVSGRQASLCDTARFDTALPDQLPMRTHYRWSCGTTEPRATQCNRHRCRRPATRTRCTGEDGG